MPGGRTPKGKGGRKGSVNNSPGAGFSNVPIEVYSSFPLPPPPIEIARSQRSTSGGGSADTISSPDTNVPGQTAKEVEKLQKQGRRSSGKQTIKFIIKTTTGHPASPLRTGVIEINEFDNKIFIYADGGWREIATW